MEGQEIARAVAWVRNEVLPWLSVPALALALIPYAPCPAGAPINLGRLAAIQLTTTPVPSYAGYSAAEQAQTNMVAAPWPAARSLGSD